MAPGTEQQGSPTRASTDMRASQLFFPTLREVPAEAELVGHRLLLRGAFMRKLAAGAYALLPLGSRVLWNIERIVREEMDAIGAQEFRMPASAASAEQTVAETFCREIRSYRDLPLGAYQVRAKSRDETRYRGGLLKSREYVVLEGLSLDQSADDLDRSYAWTRAAFARTLARLGLRFEIVEAGIGADGNPASEKFIGPAEAGEDAILRCEGCDYAAIPECCEIAESDVKLGNAPQLPLEMVETPGRRTVEQVTAFLNIAAERLVKTLLCVADGAPVAALIRGDRELSEAKLAGKIGAAQLEMADAELVRKLTGAEVGYAGPVGLVGVKIIADHEIRGIANFVTGANRNDAHYVNVKLDRDFHVDEWADLRAAIAGDSCPKCGVQLSVENAIELAKMEKLGAAPGATFSDENGREAPIVMGRYALGLTRCLAAIAEARSDGNGLIWPVSVAPFDVVIILVNPQDEEQTRAALQVYEDLEQMGVESLLDERDERSGVKFNDADLLGIPIQVVCGRLAADGKVEIRPRGAEGREEHTLEDAAAEVLSIREMERRALEESADDAVRMAWSRFGGLIDKCMMRRSGS